MASLQKFETAVSVVVLKSVLQPLRGIATKLQMRALDICSAYADIDQTLQDSQSFHDNIGEIYVVWYEETKTLAEPWGAAENIPRMAARKLHRANPPSESSIEFYRNQWSVLLQMKFLSRCAHGFHRNLEIQLAHY